MKEKIFFTALFVIALLLSYPINFPGGKPKGGSEFFADKAAYYVYLPATFIYHWDVKKFPEKIDEQTRGFTLHQKSNKVIIKTTYGVALMLTPFFVPTHLIAKTFHLQPDGFSVFYQKMMTIPGIVYVTLALFFLLRFLSFYLSKWSAYISVLLIFFGTNLYFYSVDEGLMSHVYSFFLFSAALYLMKRFLEGGKTSYKNFLWFSFVISLAILIRPTNILILLVLVFLDVKSFGEIRSRLIFFLKPRYILVFVGMVVLVYSPQLIYWKYLSGNFLYNSYPGEGFTNLKHPMVPEIWIAPLNGLFLYTPLALLFITGIVLMVFKKQLNGLFISILFLVISFLFASWLTWFFGGSCGMRPFVEYYSVFILPFGYSIEWILQRKNLFVRSIFMTVVVAFAWYGLKISYHLNYFPGSIWSWDDYRIVISDAGIKHFDRKAYTFINDFENNTLPDDVPRIFQPVHSKTLSTYLDESMEFGCNYSRRFDQIISSNLKKAEISVFMKRENSAPTGALLVCSVVDTMGKVLYYKSFNMDTLVALSEEFIVKSEGRREKGEEWNKGEEKRLGGMRGRGSGGNWKGWQKAEAVIHFPEWIPGYSKVSFYIWNLRRSKFFIDDMVIKFS